MKLKHPIEIWEGNMSVSFPRNRNHVSLHNNYEVEIQGSMKMNANETSKLRGSWDGGWGYSKFI